MALSKFEHVKISGITAVVPERVINIDDEIGFYENNPKKLERNKKILGLGSRHVVDAGTTSVDLCEDAARNLFTEMKIDPQTIDALIMVSTSHDYAYPASACVLHGRLGLNEKCAALDIAGLACSGYVYGLWTASSMIESGAVKRCLLLVGDISSTHSDIRNRTTNMLFGDAGTATLLEYSEENTSSWFYLGTRGKEWERIIAPATGYRIPVREDIANIETTDAGGNVWHLWEDIMDGMGVFQFTMDVAPASIKELAAFSGIPQEDISFYAFHQANGQIVRSISRTAGISEEKAPVETFRKYANCSTASVATVLTDQLKDKKLNNVMLVTFGVGLSWASCLIDMEQTYNGGIKIFQKPQQSFNRQEAVEHYIKLFKNGGVQ